MLIPLGFAQVNFKFTGTAVPTGAEVTLGLDVDAGGETPLDVATEVAAAWEGSLRNVQTNEVTLASILVKFGPNDVGPADELAINHAGTDVAGSCPPNTSVLIRKVTGLGGHAGRGRFYWPGVKETNVGSNGFLTPSTLSDWQGQADELLTLLTAGGLPPVVLHGEASPLSTPTPITSLIVDPRVATQRRRLRK